MSKNRKHLEAPEGSSPLIPSPVSGSSSAGSVFSRGVPFQLLAIIGLSCALGFTFNAANPVGVRFGAEQSAPAVATITENATAIVPTPTDPAPVIKPPPALPPIPVAAGEVPPVPQSPTSTVRLPPAAIPSIQVVAHPPEATAVPLNPAPIHWLEAKAMVAEGHAVLLDVRQKAMFDAGHIPGAVSLPEGSPLQDFTAFLNQQSTNDTLIVYCSSTSCSQSARVANRLVMEFRWPSVRYMTGGYLEYQQVELAQRPQPPTP